MNEKLKAAINRAAKSSGWIWVRYERCKDILREAERRKIIAGSEWKKWIEYVCEVLAL